MVSLNMLPNVYQWKVKKKKRGWAKLLTKKIFVKEWLIWKEVSSFKVSRLGWRMVLCWLRLPWWYILKNSFKSSLMLSLTCPLIRSFWLPCFSLDLFNSLSIHFSFLLPLFFFMFSWAGGCCNGIFLKMNREHHSWNKNLVLKDNHRTRLWFSIVLRITLF